VRTFVHDAPDDRVDQFEDDLTNSARRLVNGALARGVDLGVGGRDDAVVLDLSASGRFGLHLVRRRLRGGHDEVGLFPRGDEELLTFVARGRGLGLGDVGGLERLAMALLRGGRMYFAARNRINNTATTSTTNVPLGRRKTDVPIISMDLLFRWSAKRRRLSRAERRRDYCFWKT